MNKKIYIKPEVAFAQVHYEEGLMDWISTPISDDEIDDDEFNAKKGFLFEDDWSYSNSSPSLWDD